MISEVYSQNGGVFNEGLLGLKKAFSFDKTFSSIQDMWNQINDAIHKKYPNLRNINGGAGFTNGGRELKLNFSNFDTVKKTVNINGAVINWDDVMGYIPKILKSNGII